MATNPFNDPGFGGSPSSNAFDDPDFGKKKGSSLARRAGDLGVGLARGLIGVPETLTGLADIPTLGRAGKALENAGVDFKGWKDYYNQFQSPEQKAANEAVASAKGFVPTLAAAVKNPSFIAQQVAEQAPQLLAGGAISRGLGVVSKGVDAAGKAIPALGAVARGAAGEGIITAGQNVEQVREEEPSGVLTPKQVGLNSLAGVITGGIAYGGGRVANKLGLADVETMLAGGPGSRVVTAEGKKAPGMAKRVAGGFLTEGALQETPQSYQEQVFQNLSQGKPWDEGASEAAAQGGVVGGFMGAGANVIPPKPAPGPLAKPPATPETKLLPRPGDVPIVPPGNAGPIDAQVQAAAQAAVDNGDDIETKRANEELRKSQVEHDLALRQWRELQKDMPPPGVAIPAESEAGKRMGRVLERARAAGVSEEDIDANPHKDAAISAVQAFRDKVAAQGGKTNVPARNRMETLLAAARRYGATDEEMGMVGLPAPTTPLGNITLPNGEPSATTPDAARLKALGVTPAQMDAARKADVGVSLPVDAALHAPDAGPLSRAAAIAVDNGMSNTMATQARAEANAPELERQQKEAEKAAVEAQKATEKQAADAEAARVQAEKDAVAHKAELDKGLDERIAALGKESGAIAEAAAAAAKPGKDGKTVEPKVTPLQTALTTAAAPHFDGEAAAKAISVAKKEARPDVVAAIVERAHREADTAEKTLPSVAPELPQYAPIAKALQDKATAARAMAERLSKLGNMVEKVPKQAPIGEQTGTALVVQKAPEAPAAPVKPAVQIAPTGESRAPVVPAISPQTAEGGGQKAVIPAETAQNTKSGAVPAVASVATVAANPKTLGIPDKSTANHPLRPAIEALIRQKPTAMRDLTPVVDRAKAIMRGERVANAMDVAWFKAQAKSRRGDVPTAKLIDAMGQAVADFRAGVKAPVTAPKPLPATTDGKAPLFLTVKGEPIGDAVGMDSHGNLLQQHGHDNELETTRKLGLLYVDSGGGRELVISGKNDRARDTVLAAAQVRANATGKAVDVAYDADARVTIEPKAKERSSKQQARDEQLRKDAIARKHIDPSKDTLVHAITKLGGLSMKERRDITRDTKGSNPRLPFVGTLFTEKGRGLDVIAQALEEYGYLSKDELDSVDGGIGRLREMIDDEINGTPHYSTHRDIGEAMAEKFGDENLEASGYNELDEEDRLEVARNIDAIDAAIAARTAQTDDSAAKELTDGEIEEWLGEREDDHAAADGRAAAGTPQARGGSDAKPVAVAPPTGEVAPPKKSLKEHLAERAAARQAQVAAFGPVELAGIGKEPGKDRWHMVHPDVDGGGKWRVTWFDLDGFSGHEIYANQAEAINNLIGTGFTERDDLALDRLFATPRFARGLHAADLQRKANAKEIGQADVGPLLDKYDAERAKTESMSDDEADKLFDSWSTETSKIGSKPAAPTLELKGQSADEILAAEKAAQKRDADKAAADKQADDKAKADRERGDFTLAGSDRKADQNVNQDDIFSVASNIKPAPAPAAIVDTSPKESVADFGEKIGGARKDTAVPLGKRPIITKDEDARPAWARKYIAMEQTTRPRHAFPMRNEPVYQKTGKWELAIANNGKSGAVTTIRGQVFDSEAQALAAVPMAEVARNHRVMAMKDGTFAIVRKIGDRKRAVVKGGFATEKEAMTHLVTHAVEIIEHKFAFPERPWLDRLERIGETKRQGHVTTKMFETDFGFRGGEFGNWNMGGDGQASLDHAFDALHDLADNLGVPPKALSLNGELAIAFGARGTGGEGAAAAHYEPDKVVINLTKIKGAGSLAHEWFHALDHYIARNSDVATSAKLRKMLGYRDMATYGLPGTNTARPELVAAFKKVVDTMTAKVNGVAVDENQAKRRLNSAQENVKSRLAGLRSTIEKARQYGSKKTAATPAQLKAWDALVERALAGDGGAEVRVPPKFGGRLAVSHASNEVVRDLNAIFKDVTGRSFDLSDQGSEGRQLYWSIKSLTDMNARVAAAQSGTIEQRSSGTEFLDEAKKIDGYRVSDYWSTPHEMGARAFESYIFDKIAGDAKASQYLVHAVENKYYAALDMKPYPEGDERKAINAAFDELFKAIQVKDTDKGKAMYSLGDKPPVFYSALERSVAKMPFGKNGVQAGILRNWLEARAKDGTIKPDELAWSGITDWLGMQQGNVTREQVAQFIANNGVKVTETELGKTQKEDEERAQGAYDLLVHAGFNPQHDGYFWILEDEHGTHADIGALTHDQRTAWDIVRESEPEDDGEGLVSSTKFHSYTLPGGDNYRELLLTLPAQTTEAREIERLEQVVRDTARAEVAYREQRPDAKPATDGDLAKLVVARDQAGIDLTNARGGRGPRFTSSHFDQPNILAHIRFNERTDANGGKVLFIEEIQSDWAQKGRKDGFAKAPPTQEMRALIAKRDQLIAESRGIEDFSERMTFMRQIPPINARIQALGGDTSTMHTAMSGIPNAPFVGKTEAWVALAMKRMILYAVDNGFDSVAWTNGEQQAERYSLASHFDSVDWTTLVHGNIPWVRQVTLLPKGTSNNGQTVRLQVDVKTGIVKKVSNETLGQVEGKPLDEVIGKEMAQRIMSDERGTLEGAGLKIGGEGMHAFYDRIVPNVANDILKKLGGGKMATVSFETQTKPAYHFSHREPKAESFGGTQPGFAITDKMRETAGQGLPLFKQGAPATGGMRALDVQKAITTQLRTWRNAPQVRVMQSVPEGRSSTARGVYRSDGVVNLFADNLATPEKAIETLLHEVVGHGGLNGLFGSRLDPLMNSIYRSNADVRRDADLIRSHYAKHDVKLTTAGATEEVLANMAGDGKIQDLPLWKSLVAAIRNALRAIGIHVNFSDNDIAALLARARRHVEGGDKKAAVASLANPTPAMAKLSLAGAPAAAPWVKKMPADVQEFLRKAGVYAEPKSIKERFREFKKDLGTKLLQKSVDQFIPVLRRIGDYPYKLLRMASAYDGGVEAMLFNGHIKVNTAGALDVEKNTKGLLEILKPLQGEAERFLAWMAANRAERLTAEQRENLFGVTDWKAGQKLNGMLHADDNFPNGQSGKTRTMTYAKVLREFNAFSKSVLDVAEASGIINGPSRAIWEHQFYVPFFREQEEDRPTGPGNVSGMVNQYAFKKLKGGTDVLHDLLANTVNNWSHLLQASLKNNAAWQTLEHAANLPNPIARQVREPEKGSVFVLRDGVKEHYVIDDPLVYDAVSSLETQAFRGPVMKAMSTMKHLLSAGVTLAPAYRIRNVIRDQISALAVNPTSYNLIDNLIKGFKYSSRNNPEYGSMLAGGGLFRMGLAYGEDRAAHTKHLLARGIDAATVLDSPGKVKEALNWAWEWWQETGNRAESLTRAQLYKQTYKRMIDSGKSADDAHFEASFVARDSMDFGLQGTAPAIRMLTQVVPFMNARLQGLYKLKRGAEADPKRFAAVIGGVTLATIALTLAYRGDPDYDKREEFDRDNYWWFKVGGKAFKIPKPFEIGALATIIDRGLEAAMNGMTKEDQIRFGNSVWSNVANQLNMNPVPQAVWPAIQLWANKDAFTGRSIESEHEKNLSVANRIGQNTSQTAQLLGKAGVLSPVQIDFLANAYFAWAGAHVMATVDLALRPLMDAPAKAAPKIDDYFLVGDFVKELPSQQARFVERFYTHLKDAQEALGDLRNAQKTGQVEEAARLAKEGSTDLRMAHHYIAVSREIGKLNSRIRWVNMSTSMEPEAKRAELDRLSALRNRMTETIENQRTTIEASRAR